MTEQIEEIINKKCENICLACNDKLTQLVTYSKNCDEQPSIDFETWFQIHLKINVINFQISHKVNIEEVEDLKLKQLILAKILQKLFTVQNTYLHLLSNIDCTKLSVDQQLYESWQEDKKHFEETWHVNVAEFNCEIKKLYLDLQRFEQVLQKILEM